MRRAFTLVELMIVVAIIGILAAIAIPNFVSMQYRAKRAEVPSNVSGIKDMELAFEAGFDKFIQVNSYAPDSSPAKQQRAWTTGSAFDSLGWSPDGEVRGSYKVVTVDGGGDFTVSGICDVDGDAVQATYTASKTVNPTLLTNNDVY